MRKPQTPLRPLQTALKGAHHAQWSEGWNPAHLLLAPPCALVQDYTSPKQGGHFFSQKGHPLPELWAAPTQQVPLFEIAESLDKLAMPRLCLRIGGSQAQAVLRTDAFSPLNPGKDKANIPPEVSQVGGAPACGRTCLGLRDLLATQFETGLTLTFRCLPSDPCSLQECLPKGRGQDEEAGSWAAGWCHVFATSRKLSSLG